MKKISEIKKYIAENRPFIADKFKVKKIGIFGSYATNQAAAGSDLDILIEFYEPIGFFAFLDLERYLTDLLGVKVDLVSKKALKPLIGKHILRELIVV